MWQACATGRQNGGKDARPGAPDMQRNAVREQQQPVVCVGQPRVALPAHQPPVGGRQRGVRGAQHARKARIALVLQRLGLAVQPAATRDERDALSLWWLSNESVDSADVGIPLALQK